MNDEDKSYCFTNGYRDGEFYMIPSDNQGNNIVTGQGSKEEDDDKRFTCLDLEVFSVIY